jgi:4-amino-4-deoxy-L-arabinose transferase-like glycosyltransferase
MKGSGARATTPDAGTPPRWRAPLLLAGATVLALAPFANKAFHIDDTLFLAAARQIRSRPLDFYGFAINWYGAARPMSEVMKNPPLDSYFIAAVAAIAGESETALHLAFLLPAVAAVLGTYSLARRFCARPAAAALVTLGTPVFLVSATNVMCDTMLLAFWVWAVELWVGGIETGRARALVAASLLAALAALTKYFGVALLPLLLVYGTVRRRRLGPWALPLLLIVGVLAAYQVWTLSLYGRGLFFDAASYAGSARSRLGMSVPEKTVAGLSFLGGCLASAAFFIPWLWRRAALVAGAVAALLGFALVFAGRIAPPPLRGAPGAPGTAIQVAVFAAAGVSALALAAVELYRLRNALSVILFLWLFGTFAFAIFFNWTINGRSLLPAAPAIGILLVQRLELRRGAIPLPPLAAGLLLALAVAWADFHLAGIARTAAAQLAQRFASAGKTLWFEGHWGFQYYMEARGAAPLDVELSRLTMGDRIVIPDNNSNLFPLTPETVAPRARTDYAAFPFLTTLSPELGAGFYVDIWGPLPFAFGRVPPERYLVLDVVRDVPPGKIEP